LFQAEAVRLIATGQAPRIPQAVEGATYDPKMTQKSAKVWDELDILL